MSKQLIYGTANKAKFEWMEDALKGTDIKLLSLLEYNTLDLNSDVVETGDTPEENALFKAKFFYKQLQQPILAADSGLYFCDYPLNHPIQPGCYVRRVNNKRLNDKEMTEYYKSIAKDHGGKIAFQYRNSLALVINDKQSFTIFDETTSSPIFYLLDHEINSTVEGFPLDAITLNPDFQEKKEGFKNFIVEHLKYL